MTSEQRRHILTVLMLGSIVFSYYILCLMPGAERMAIAQKNEQVLMSNAQNVLRLRGSLKETLTGKPNTNVLISGVRTCMEQTGIAAPAFKGITPLSDTVEQATQLRYNRMQLEFNQISLQQLGEWLACWMPENQAWLIERVQCIHAAEQTANDGNTFNFTLGLLAISLD